MKWFCRLVLVFLFSQLLFVQQVQAQDLGLGRLLGTEDTQVSGRIIQLTILLTILSVAPGLLMMVTCFTRLIVALSFLRAGLGLQTTPANLILLSLALFMTFYIMGPTFDRAWEDGIKPYSENKISEEEAYKRTTAPLRSFMLTHVREKDLKLFQDMAEAKLNLPQPQNGEVELRVLIPAFMISELRRGFEIGFLILLPFLVIDMIVATLTMSMGMMMLPPTVISLPFKIMFFVLIDGWNLLVGGLLRSF